MDNPLCELCQDDRRWAVFQLGNKWFCADCYRDAILPHQKLREVVGELAKAELLSVLPTIRRIA